MPQPGPLRWAAICGVISSLSSFWHRLSSTASASGPWLAGPPVRGSIIQASFLPPMAASRSACALGKGAFTLNTAS